MNWEIALAILMRGGKVARQSYTLTEYLFIKDDWVWIKPKGKDAFQWTTIDMIASLEKLSEDWYEVEETEGLWGWAEAQMLSGNKVWNERVGNRSYYFIKNDVLFFKDSGPHAPRATHKKGEPSAWEYKPENKNVKWFLWKGEEE